MSIVALHARGSTVTLAGPLLLGYLFNICLYGIFSAQVYLYYLAFPRDKRLNQVVVCTLYVLETSQTVLLIASAFRSFASHYGDEEALVSVYLDWFAVPMLAGIVSCISQLYYARRIAILSGSKLLALVAALLSLLQGTTAVIDGAQLFGLDSLLEVRDKTPITSPLWCTVCVVCDTFIAACTTWILLRRDVEFPENRVMITRVIRLVVETGILSALVAIVNFVLFMVYPNEGYYLCGAVVCTKLYSTSLLVLFNSRVHIVGGRNDYASSNEIWSPRRDGDAEWGSAQRIGPFTSAAQLGPVAARELPSLGDAAYSGAGDQSMCSISGDQSMCSISGDQSMCSVSGDQSMSFVPGDQSMSFVTGSQSYSRKDSDDLSSRSALRL